MSNLSFKSFELTTIWISKKIVRIFYNKVYLKSTCVLYNKTKQPQHLILIIILNVYVFHVKNQFIHSIQSIH